jgi:hypothetical protein
MQITSFNPFVLTEKADEVIALFEALGFERRHKKTGINDKDITSVSMKDANGFHVDVAQVEPGHMPKDMTAIRMNVRDFEEAYDFLTSKGFTNAGGKITETSSSRSVLMVSPTGFAINLCQHIRKEERN